ncbi:MAG: type IX secretion system periplasmic lipoprotein PorW/SprE [Bacteroidia bacterium]
MKATSAARIFTLLLLISGLAACDKNRDTFLNRSYQNMVAHFNVYFNGQQKLEMTRLSLEKAHVDDFTKVIDVFPYGSDANRKSQSGQMDEVIKKASRVIAERPISKWVDDAYFMMGQAYFFKGDYFAAIETFQFLNSQYKGTTISYEATLWIIKSYVLLGKAKDAEAIIGLLNNDPDFPPKLKASLHEVSAYVYIRVEKYKIAAENMEKALPLAKGSYKKARYHYILGQLYAEQGDRNKARDHYKIVTKGSPPYEMAFNAKINLARNYDPANKSEVRSARKYLKSMLKDDKNTAYFAQVYYELGLIEKKEGNSALAIENFKLSNQNNRGNSDQKALCFLALADIYFARPDYHNAQIYYDSAVYFLKPEFKDYERLKAKQEVLSELIKNLILIQREDSLLKLATLPAKEIDNLVEKAIKEEERRREEAKKKDDKKGPDFNPIVPNNPFNPPAGSGSSFYFADPMQVARGYNEFISQYGERPNVDNWQFNSIAAKATFEDGDGGEGDGNEDPEKAETKPEMPKDSAGLARYQYIKDIPFTPEAKKSSRDRIASAYLKVGEIYYEQLKDYPESEKAFQSFLSQFGDHAEVPKALFYMYKIRSAENQTDQANVFKARLITEYPNSPYSKYLTQEKDPNAPEEEGIDPKVINAYKSAYESYKAGNFRGVIEAKKSFDRTYYGTVIQPKFDLLEALSYARIDSGAACIRLLEALVANYPTTAQGLEAQQILEAYKRQSSETGIEEVTKVQYTYSPENKHYFIMLMPERKTVSMNQIKARFSDFNKKQVPDGSFSVEELLVGERQFLVIKEFTNAEGADAYRKLVLSDPDFLKSLAAPGADFFVCDPKNLGLMVVNSDLEGFLKFTKTYYIQK